MKKIVLPLLLIGIAYLAGEFFFVSDKEVIVDTTTQRVVLAAGLLGFLAVLLAFGEEKTRFSMILALVCGITASLAAVFVASFPAPLAQDLDQDELVRRFRVQYYENQLFKNDYLGMRCLQYPTDQWVMQEMITDVRPDFIVETGTWSGATTLYYAHLLEKLKPEAKIVTVDIEPHGKQAPRFPAWDERIEFILGDSVSDEVVNQIYERVKGGRVMVSLDSSHATDHVAKELERYSPLVSIDSYIVVQDTHLGGNPNQHPSVDNPGPLPAVREFLKEHPEFEIDRSREKHMLTQNPSGYLKRIR